MAHRYEHLFPVMISLGAVELDLRANSRVQGIPVGGAHIDLLCRAEAITAILRSLRLELDLDKVRESAEAAYLDVLKNWNRRREWQVHRCVDCGSEKQYVNKIMKLLDKPPKGHDI